VRRYPEYRIINVDKLTYAGICPYCMIDSVLADADWKDLSPEFLEKMRKFFF
jgi:hypothetical protein